ncbi:hypothetical protein BKA65DRAFT_200701 [Rhexocercosporidium sp. MPI-PUGE-AT-0058]|nr:hypothetical protein BKA65DRAFT_200701 [Rhexocercosporidium sp. MPI-PUGE-AT-0058]
MTNISSQNHVSSVKNAPKEYVFVEVAKTGRVTNKKQLHNVRKHIMKDIGKSRRKNHRGSDKPQQKANIRSPPAMETTSPYSSLTDISDRSIPRAWSLGSGRTDPFACYPIPVDQDLLFLIDHVNTCSDIQLRPFKDIWLPISISDAAFFNEILSHVSLHVYTLRHGLSRATECPQSMVLHSRAVNSVRKRLDDPVLGISDGVIGTVLAFACFSHRINYWETYDMHMAALYQIVKRRGGVSSLIGNPTLRKLMSGIDLAATCFLEKPHTLFPLPEISDDSNMPTTTLPWPIPPASNKDQSIWKHSFLNDSPLLPIFHDMTDLMLSLKSDSIDHRKVGGPLVLINRAAVFSLVSRLDDISIPIEDITPDNLVQECCRIGGMLLLGGVYDHFPSQGFPYYVERFMDTASLARKLHTILLKLGRYKQWVLLKPLLVWSVALGALSSDNSDEVNDFLNLILFAGRWLGLHNWMEALMVAGNLLWVGEVFDERYKRLIASKKWEFDASIYK